MATAVIVGGTSGIGLATARRLRDQGADVHVVGRAKERLAAVDADLHTHQADGGDPTAMAAVAATIGRVDWLVVTLSGGEGMGPLAELDLAGLRRAFDAKFWAHLTTLQAMLPRLAPDGSITLVSAASARSAMPGTAGLAAINGALESMIPPLAVELAPIRVNAVSPGVVDTAWWHGMPAAAREQLFATFAAALPTRRIATAADVAEVVALAATNRNLSGTVLETDGGARLVSIP